jgi:hypothetical protein
VVIRIGRRPKKKIGDNKIEAKAPAKSEQQEKEKKKDNFKNFQIISLKPEPRPRVWPIAYATKVK